MSDTAQWTPDQPLRFDATDEQLNDRYQYLWVHEAGRMDWKASPALAREFAHAQVAHLCETTNELLADWERRYEKLQDELESASRVPSESPPAQHEHL